MNLYKFHKNPASLNHYEDSFEFVPEFAWEKYKNDKEELEKRENIWARDAETAYWYAENILKGPFPKGEGVIATDADMAYMYARAILKGPFPKGEAAIITDPDHAFWYIKYVLKKPWPEAEPVIFGTKHKFYKNEYLVMFPERADK